MMPPPLWALILVGFITGAATLVGGSLALRFRSTLNLLLGFSSGTIIGVALFDLLPEALDLAGERHSHLSITTALAVGFALYLVADWAGAMLGEDKNGPRHFAPASLTAHSLLDGLGIGLAFHVSPAAGTIVAIGVLGHDVIDGANTVTASLASGISATTARRWLAANAIAPVTGILLAQWVDIPSFTLAILLGVFGGFFLYIGASVLLPQSRARDPRLSNIVATATGLAFIYIVISVGNR